MWVEGCQDPFEKEITGWHIYLFIHLIFGHSRKLGRRISLSRAEFVLSQIPVCSKCPKKIIVDYHNKKQPELKVHLLISFLLVVLSRSSSLYICCVLILLSTLDQTSSAEENHEVQLKASENASKGT